MNPGTHSIAIAVIAPLVLVGCGERAPMDEGSAQSGEMPGMETRADTSAEHTALGTLNSVDRAAGTVNISHEPVASAGWPAMTMNFKLANPEAAESLTAGQRVEFRFTTDGGGTVTRIESQ